MALLHKHHIVPRHMGGTDNPSNIIELTVSEHAEAHRLLYEKYGLIDDWLAYRGLLGMIGKEEIISELNAVSRGSKWYFNPEIPTERRMIRQSQLIPPGWIPGRGLIVWIKNRRYSKPSPESTKRKSETLKRRWKEGAFSNRKPPKRNKKALHKKKEPVQRFVSVEINGVSFVSCGEAARHYGVCQATITYWISTGKAIKAGN